jgi:hypothetical protein
MENEGRWIIWPERRFVPAKNLISWAQDAVANGEVSDMFKDLEVKSLNDAVEVLNDSGNVTFWRGSEPPFMGFHEEELD